MARIKKETYTVIVENQINEREVFAEIKAKHGDVAAMVILLNKNSPNLIYEYISKPYFLANKDHYKNVKR